jgi:hypothetical protein
MSWRGIGSREETVAAAGAFGQVLDAMPEQRLQIIASAT